jgi:hypothetical protein
MRKLPRQVPTEFHHIPCIDIIDIDIASSRRLKRRPAPLHHADLVAKSPKVYIKFSSFQKAVYNITGSGVAEHYARERFPELE